MPELSRMGSWLRVPTRRAGLAASAMGSGCESLDHFSLRRAVARALSGLVLRWGARAAALRLCATCRTLPDESIVNWYCLSPATPSSLKMTPDRLLRIFAWVMAMPGTALAAALVTVLGMLSRLTVGLAVSNFFSAFSAKATAQR